MNRKEAMHTLKDIFDYFWIDIEDKGIDGELTEIMEALESPLTLANFLGWEEGVVYRRGGSYFKIEGNHLLHKGHSGKWVNMNLQTWELIDLQQATKVEKKLKAYHVKDEYSYNCLMKELEEQGYVSIIGTNLTNLGYWEKYKQKTVIYCNEDKSITYSQLSYYETDKKDKYELIEYHKEPLYYAIDRIGKLDNDNSYYLIRCYDEFSKKYYYGNIEKESADKLTKKEWNKLGINDSNADFEKVED